MSVPLALILSVVAMIILSFLLPLLKAREIMRPNSKLIAVLVAACQSETIKNRGQE